MRQTMLMAQPRKCIWLCFCNARNESFEKHQVTRLFDNDRLVDAGAMPVERAACDMITIPGGFTERKLYCWLRMLRPSVVHYQGALRTEIERAVHTLGLASLSGFHFWHGMIELDERRGNVRIVDKAAHHRIYDPYLHTERRSDVVYCPSAFFREAIEAVCGKKHARHLDIVSPMSDEHEISTLDRNDGHAPEALFPGDSIEQWPRGYVTIVNIHESKGGRLFLHLIKTLPPTIGLLGVRTDVHETALDRQIDAALRDAPSAFICGRVSDIRRIYSRTALLLQPSECDETFCRVLVEAHCNALPTLSSDYGNLPYLHFSKEARERCVVGTTDERPVADMSIAYYDMWRERIEREWSCLHDENDQSLGALCRRNFEDMKRALDVDGSFRRVMAKASAAHEERSKRIALLTPWCDQGLGIQTRNYARVLRKNGYKVFVFSFMPYTGAREQADPSEWQLDGVDVYYSPNHRESVVREELMAFVVRTRVSRAIIAETCWHRVFSMMSELRSLGVRTFAVPNVEIVRTDEIEKHRVFDTILLNNRSCERLFRNHGFPMSKTAYVGYSIEPGSDDNVGAALDAAGSKPPLCDAHGRRVLKLLVLGGRNAVSRKYVHVLIDAFLSAVPAGTPMRLVATSQLECAELTALMPRIRERHGDDVQLLIGNLTSSRIDELYSECDIVLQVSKHEGLGIGFFEAQRYNKPIITLDIEPHNECAPADVAWHLQPDAMIANPENNSCGVLSAVLSSKTVVPLFSQFASALGASKESAAAWWRDEYAQKQQRIAEFQLQRRARFESDFIKAIGMLD